MAKFLQHLSNQIIVDDTIARKYELSLGSISGIVPIDKGGTNNSLFNTNRLVYYDGNQLTSFPLETGRIRLLVMIFEAPNSNLAPEPLPCCNTIFPFIVFIVFDLDIIKKYEW